MSPRAPLWLLPALLLAAGGCSLLIDTSLEEGYPCEEDGRCLEGYHCREGLCVPIPDDPSWDPCEGACGELERCDRDSATCVPICHDAVCPTGDVCLDSAGGCTQVAGLGQLCDDDSACEQLLAGCSDDPDDPGTVECVCLMPATMARSGSGAKGICVGLPREQGDCSACGMEADCVEPLVSSAGADGERGRRAVCVPKGFGLCERDEDCHHSQGHTVCTYFGRPTDPQEAGWPEGLFSACATPSWDFDRGYGDPCEPEDPLGCDTGVCIPTGNGEYACSTPCTTDAACGGGLGSCVDTVVSLGPAADPFAWDVARACGQGYTLGDSCDLHEDPSFWPCGSDAPECVDDGHEEVCTRPCRKDADCEDELPHVCSAVAGGHYCVTDLDLGGG